MLLANRNRALIQMSDPNNRKKISESLKIYYATNPVKTKIKVNQYDLNEILIYTFDSIKSVCDKFNFNRSFMSQILKRSSNPILYKGYLWKKI